MRLRRLVPLLVGALLLLATPGALAHLDERLGSGDETFSLAPGESRAFAFDVHYHRLIGRVEVAGDAPVHLALYGDDAYRAVAAGETAVAPFWQRGEVRGAIGLNVLIDCCDDASYAPFHLVVTHAGTDGAADVRLAAKAAHDDLVVGMSGAEGDIFQNTALFWLVGAFVGHRTVRALRVPDASARGAPDARALLRRSVAAAAAPFAAWALAAAWGAWRYGGGVTGGAVATFGVLAPSFGIALLVMLFLAAWVYALVVWLRAYRAALAGRAGAAAATSTIVTGCALAFLFAMTPFLLVPEYGVRVLRIGAIMPLPLALVALVASAHLARQRPAPAP